MSNSHTDTGYEYESDLYAAVVNHLIELRYMMYGLCVLVLLMSLALNLFIRRQNRNLQSQVENINQQISQIEQSPVFQQNKTGMENLLSELSAQFPARPEAKDILARYGFRVEERPQTPAP